MKVLICGLMMLMMICALAGARTLRADSVASKERRLWLRENWAIKSSAQVKETGDVLSGVAYAQRDWYPARVPSTVVGTLVQDKVYPDPYFGMNLRSLPGCTYPIGKIFSNLEMPPDSPYRSSWWYRTEFQMPSGYQGQNIWLHFDGINFRANIWLNGRQIASADDVAGTFRLFEFNITDAARAGALNSLAVEVFPPRVDDLAWTWVDWNPTPPDKDMGIWRDVYLTASGTVTLRYQQVITRFDLPSLDTARLNINAEVRNTTNSEILGTLRGRLAGLEFSQSVKLGPLENRIVAFSPEQFRQLNIAHPRVWWPAHLGEQNLYDLDLEFETGGRVSDHQTTRFGMREVTSELDQKGHRIFRINGQRILIRGGGWANDMMLRRDPERLEAEMRYVSDMHLNAIRLEGKLESEELFNLADRYGILIMAGWCCCDHWEHWEHRDDYKDGPTWDDEDYRIAALSQADQIRRLRNHPSVFVWLNGSDNPPPPKVEQMYIDVLKKYQWPNPYLSSATAKQTKLTGLTGVKMEGPYEWVPPAYWLQDKEHGGAHGFATEISPGPAVPPVESLRRMLPQDHLWPIDEVWNFHAGGGQFKNIKVFTDALNARYGPAKNVEDYAAKSQLMAYEGQRAMFEGFGGNKYNSSGVIQWMLNNAWPSLIWHLYDYYLRPAGGYFGTKKACEPIHVQYHYDDKSVVVVNSTYQPRKNLKVSAKVYDINLNEKFSKDAVLDSAEDSSQRVFAIPEILDLTRTYFLKLTLTDSRGALVSRNFYWLSTKADVLNWNKSTWYYTPVTSYADITALQQLSPVKLNASGHIERQGASGLARVTVRNPSRNLAFFIHLKITGERDGEEVLPVLWQDNYFELMPGESRELTASYQLKDQKGSRLMLNVEGWNVTQEKQLLLPAVGRK
jgi:exo-1,4-beta-D-glucosaminidase